MRERQRHFWDLSLPPPPHPNRAYLTKLLEEARQNISEAARRARMDRPYLIALAKRYGLR
jgi:transcriptional regulator with GAF, ATPase, and Fis domain